ncbi:MAG: TetR/AcrR family transcriptional regulator [Candidatus Krumholzibacteriota bacterium]|nr:TetR/AcrR family transcriptional regulator [Candidatus Krumholzibacteriota bacterium]
MMIREDGSSGRQTRKEREEGRLRSEILTAAARLFARQSFQKTSMQQIADDVEISVGRIYRFFDGKEEIFRELVEGVIAFIDRVGDAEVKKHDSPMRGLRSAFREIYMNIGAEHRDFLMILHNENPIRMKRYLLDYLVTQRRSIARMLGEAMDRGEIRRENPYILATMMVASAAAFLADSLDSDMQFTQAEYYETFERVMFDSLETGRGAAAETKEPR